MPGYPEINPNPTPWPGPSLMGPDSNPRFGMNGWQVEASPPNACHQDTDPHPPWAVRITCTSRLTDHPAARPAPLGQLRQRLDGLPARGRAHADRSAVRDLPNGRQQHHEMVSDAELAEAIRPGYELSRLCLSLAYFGHPMAMLSELGQAPPSDAILAALVLAMELADLLHSTGVDDVGFARYQTAAAASPPEVPDVRDRC